MPRSTYLANKILEHETGKTTYTKPTNVYLALYTSNPTAADTGTEVTGGSYARQAVTWGTAASRSISNSAQAQFTGLPTATITHWGLRDASTAGNLLRYGTFTAPIYADASNNPSVTIATSTLTFNESS